MRNERSSSVLPIPTVKRRVVDEHIEQRARMRGFSAVVARVLGGRRVASSLDLATWLAPSLEHLDPADTLADIDLAAQRLAGAILAEEVIGIATDYDMDGLGAHAVFRLALVEMFGHPPQRLCSYIGHRLAEGYGLTTAMAMRILSDAPRPSLLVTADSGSGDEPRIAELKAAGMDVLVTDHHELPAGGPPPSAYACVNPKRTDCAYPDKAIAGGMVVWLLLRAVREILQDVGHGPAQRANLDELLDFVACSTVADCVSLAGHNNRAVVRAGLALMNQAKRPCWQALAEFLPRSDFQAQTIAFAIAPRINARSRLSDPFAALHFLLARDVRSAHAALKVLDEENRTRKAIEKEMVEDATAHAARQVGKGRNAIALVLPQGHPGVQGICSSRLVETFGRPVFLFSPNAVEPGLLSGSARTIDGIHVQQILLEVDRRAPGLIQRFGGHKAAAGAQIRATDFPAFEALFERVTQEAVVGEPLGPLRWSDGALAPADMTLELLDEIEALEPTGRGFEAARFDGVFEVLEIREIGDGTHLRLVLRQGECRLPAVWFRARRSVADPLPVDRGARAHLVYGLAEDHYRGARRLQLRIEACVSGRGDAPVRLRSPVQADSASSAPWRQRASRSSRRIGAV